MIMKNVLLGLLFLIGHLQLSHNLLAQPFLEWEKNYGGTALDGGLSGQQTVDGGYVVVGNSQSNDGDVGGNNGITDIWVLKLDVEGDLEWEENYGGTGDDIGFSIQQTTDNGYIVLGISTSIDGDVGGNNGSTDVWVVKLDMDGNLEWEENYGGTDIEQPYSIQQTTDGGYIVLAISESSDGDVGGNNGEFDIWCFKLNMAGDLEWEKNYGGSGFEAGGSIRQTTGGGYIVSCGTGSDDGDVGDNNGSFDVWILKLNTEGNLEWEKNYGGSGFDFSGDIRETEDGGYVVVGNSKSNDGDVGGNNGSDDIWLVKLDVDGNLEWEKNYGGTLKEFSNLIQQTEDDGYIVVGYSNSNDVDVGGNNGDQDIWVLKLDVDGNLEWEKNYGGTSQDFGNFIQETIDGSYIVMGSTMSNDGDVTMNNGDRDVWILKLSPTAVSVQEENVEPRLTISPNPSNGQITIASNDLIGPATIRIVDLLGLPVYAINEVQETLKIENISSGSYFVHVTADGVSFTKKLIVH